MPRERLDDLQQKLLREILIHAWNNSRFYRDLWSSSGLGGPPTCVEELANVPFVSKQDMVKDFPYGFVAVPREDLVRMYLTSGSSGRPAAVFLSRRDLDAAADLGARSLFMRGVRHDDILQITLAYGLWAAALGAHGSSERLGCLTIPSGPGNTQRQIWIMKNMGTTVLSAVPSYHLRIAEVGEGMGLDFSSLPLRIAQAMAGRLGQKTRREIEDRMSVVVRNIYGMTEVGGIGSECQMQDGLHVWKDAILMEVVDPETGDPLAQGERGELVVTTLRRFALPLIRYRTGDMVTIVNNGPCACGRTHPRLSGEIDRVDDTVKIRGVLVSPSAIEKYIRRLPELSGRFLIQVRPRSRPTLLCELRSSVETAYTEEIVKSVTTDLKNKIGLTFQVDLVRLGELPEERGDKRIQVIPDSSY